MVRLSVCLSHPRIVTEMAKYVVEIRSLPGYVKL